MMNSFNDEYLAHYGVLGMKWGVRKYQSENGNLTEAGKKRYSKEFSKSTKHLRNLYYKAERGATDASTKNMVKATKLMSKGNKIEAKAAKAGKKEAKLENKLNKSGWRNQKQIDKYVKYKTQSAKLHAKAAKYISKSSDIDKNIKKGEAKFEKYIKKGDKFYNEMLKTFGDVPVSVFNPKDVQMTSSLVKTYGNQTLSTYKFPDNLASPDKDWRK